VQEIALRHGGNVTAQAVLPQGLKVQIQLPQLP
jgi:signal transduction histidine kinase